jgi:hypothetical protein
MARKPQAKSIKPASIVEVDTSYAPAVEGTSLPIEPIVGVNVGWSWSPTMAGLLQRHRFIPPMSVTIVVRGRM